MKTIIEKYFKKTDKDIWITWEDYKLKELINPEYGFFNTATIHCPITTFLNSSRLEDRMYKIILHRTYDRENITSNLEDGESLLVYKGLLENEEDLEFLLHRLGIRKSN